MAVNVQPVPPNREYNETVRRFLDLLRRQVNTNTGGIQDIIDSLSAYTLVDGSRPFTAPVGGVTPVASTDLTTKAYVDGLVSGSGFWQRNGTTLSPQTAGDNVDLDGNLTVDGTTGLGTSTPSSSSRLHIYGTDADTSRLIIDRSGSQALFGIDGSLDVNITSPNGYKFNTSGLTNSPLTILSDGRIIVEGSVAFAQTSLNAGLTTRLSLGVRAIASQTGDLFDIQDVGGISHFKIDATGNLTFNEGNQNQNFTIEKSTGGTAYSYTASTDYHLWSGDWESDVFKYLDVTTGGIQNLFVGNNAGNFSGVNGIVAVGYQAGKGATGGSVSVGHLAQANATSSNSVGIGRSALRSNTQNGCVGVGSYVMQTNTGTYTSGYGSNTLETNTGNLCCAFGAQAMRFNTGRHTNAFGFQTFNVNEGNNSNGFGYRVFLKHETGNNNTAFGHEAGFNNITGAGLVLLGHQAGYNETGSNKLYISNSQNNNLIYGEFDNELVDINGQLEVIGQNDAIQLTVKGNATQTANLQEWHDSLGTNLAHITNDGTFGQGGVDVFKTSDAQTGSANCIAIGGSALENNTGANSIGAGLLSLQNNTATDSNGFGVSSLQFNSGIRSNGFGFQSLRNNTGGSSNGFGYRSLQNNTGGNSSGFGHQSLQNNTGFSVNGFGLNSLQNNTGGNSCGFGNSSLRHNTGFFSNAFGVQSLENNQGDYSNAFGYQAFLNHTTGDNNTGVGHRVGYNNLTGSGLVLIGYEAGYDELGSNKLYISNSRTNNLIYGEFDNEIVRINGDLQVKQKQTFDSYTNSSKGAGDLWFESNALWFQSANDERAVTLSNGTITADTSVSNTITETTVATLSISADEFHVGEMIKAKFFGRYDTANASDTFTARLKVGGVTVATLNSDPQNVTNAGLDLEFIFTVRSIGATGSIFGHAHGSFNTTLKQSVNDSATVIDTTTNNDITLTIEWDASDVSNSVTISQQYLEFIG